MSCPLWLWRGMSQSRPAPFKSRQDTNRCEKGLRLLRLAPGGAVGPEASSTGVKTAKQSLLLSAPPLPTPLPLKTPAMCTSV